jgi:hypothetical protein
MALNTVTEKSISYSQPSFAAIHRWSIRHNDGGDYSEAKSDNYFSFTETFPHQSPLPFSPLLRLIDQQQMAQNIITKKSISPSQ